MLTLCSNSPYLCVDIEFSAVQIYIAVVKRFMLTGVHQFYPSITRGGWVGGEVGRGEGGEGGGKAPR